MDYRIKHFNKGFSIIELLVVIGIFSILFSVSTSVYNNFRSHSDLEISANSLVEAIRVAQASSQSGKGDSKWGVEIFSDNIVVFKGENYSLREVSFDESYNFSGRINASGLSEVIFEKLTGDTATVGTIILSNGSESKNININEKGTITY